MISVVPTSRVSQTSGNRRMQPTLHRNAVSVATRNLAGLLGLLHRESVSVWVLSMLYFRCACLGNIHSWRFRCMDIRMYVWHFSFFWSEKYFRNAWFHLETHDNATPWRVHAFCLSSASMTVKQKRTLSAHFLHFFFDCQRSIPLSISRKGGFGWTKGLRKG